jgi:TolB-like protein/Tfp pilus assembly protein PilF
LLGVSSRVCFGEFEADLRARELRRNGAKIPLQQQPFQVLAALLERPGQVITRDEIRQLIWSADTFVDFERGLNKAVNRLRDALGDSAQKPRLIETLTGRGYRLLLPVLRSIDSVAVLPFKNSSGNRHQEYWAEGVTDELITRLAAMGGARVISRTSCAQFKNCSAAMPDIARRLRVEGVIEGSVAVTGRKIKIRAQLVHAPQDQLLWAASYECDLANILTLQDQIVREIAIQVRTRSAPSDRGARVLSDPRKTAIYQNYLRGRFFWNKRTPADLNKAITYFQRAANLDPMFAPAHAGLADSHVVLGILGLLRPRDAFPKAKVEARTALALDETLAETHATLGHIRWVYDWDWRSAQREFKKAVELNFNCCSAHMWYGNLLTLLHRDEEAISELKIARDLDPLSLPVNAFLGFVYMRLRQYDLALTACQDAIELDVNNPFGHWMLARVLDARGELRKSLIESKKAVRLSNGGQPFAAHLGYAYARLRDRKRARAVIDMLIKSSARRYVSPYLIALIYTGLGQNDSAFEWLEKAYADRAPRLTELFDEPFANMRSDARFRGLSQRVGLPPA